MSESAAESEAAASAKALLSQVVLLDAAFAHRGDPLSLPQDTKMLAQRISVNVDTTPFSAEGAIAVRVHIATDRNEEGVLYDFAVTLAGVLARTPNTPVSWAEREFAEIGTTLLYPFVRETVANITGRGRFGPIWINPFDVIGLFKGIDREAMRERRGSGA